MDAFDQPKDFGRRVFVRGIGYASLGLVFASLLGGCEKLIKQIANRPVRRRLRTGSAEVDQAIAVYKDAVTKMRLRNDARSWAAQAGLHGTVNAFNFCAHGSPHFFSWHRAYLNYFEQICRELTGDKTFGLPYWNWNQNPVMHAEFTNPASPLYMARNSTNVTGNSAFSNGTLTNIFQDTNFYTFSSQIEGTPHNTAHVVVGQTMVTGASPLDPIFWMHHCMVDYCWAKWNIELGNDNTNDPGWTNTSWNHFVNGKGDPVTIEAGWTVLMPLLSYRYETSAIGDFDADKDVTAMSNEEAKMLEQRLRKGAPIAFDVKRRVALASGATLRVAQPFSVRSRATAQEFSAVLEADEASERVFLSVNFTKPPAATDFFVRAFLNLPTAGAQTSTDDPHYAGTFSFFGTATMGHAHAGHAGPKTEFLVNVTETLKRLRRTERLTASDPLTVQLVAVPAEQRFSRADTELVLRDIQFIVTPVIVRSR